MRTTKDVEAYLEKLNRHYAAVDGSPGTYLLETQRGMPPVALRVDAPLVVVRVNIGNLPTDPSRHVDILRKLLAANVKKLVHASFGLEDNRVVLTSALELENLDFNEIQAVLDEIDLALAEEVPALADLVKSPPPR